LNCSKVHRSRAKTANIPGPPNIQKAIPESDLRRRAGVATFHVYFKTES
jgi:hypothetical protein